VCTSGLSCCTLPPGLRRFVAECLRAHKGLWFALSLIPLCSLAAYAGSTTVTLSPTSLTFGTQLRNTTSPPQTVTLTNTGTASLSISGIQSSAKFSQTNNCTASLVAGASCAISVSFTPNANGTVSGSLMVTDNAGGSPQSVSLSGTGTVASLSPSSVTFGNQTIGTSSPAQIITLSNVGSFAVQVSAITIQGANPGDFSQSNTCASIAAGGSCAMNVTFTPAATGSFTATVNVSLTSSVSPIPATLAGTGVSRGAPIPFLNQPLVPMTLPPGGSGSTLTVKGAGFVANSSVLWNGSSRTTTYVSPTQVQAALSSADVASAGTAQVVVTNPSPGGGASNPQMFQITNPTSTVLFGRNDLTVGTDPRGMAIGDFNGDGKPDVAVVDRGINAVSILLGNGDGTFAAAASYAVGFDSIALAVGDFNGDGKLDLVTANRAAYTISILLGNGDGTFGSPVDYTAGTEPMAVAVGDFNGDGSLDVAAVNNADNTVSIFLGVGNGTLQTPVIYSLGAGPIAIVTGDFNGDGNLDLAAANSGSDTVCVLLGNGDGTFQNAAFYATGSDPSGLIATDLNGDGKLDLVAANDGSNSISVLLNAGNGAFASNVAYPVGVEPFALSAGDFYGNGKIGVAVANSGDNTVSIVPGNGDGTFNASAALTFGIGDVSLGIGAADFGLDGRADLVVSNSEDNTVSVLLQIPGVTLSGASLAFGSQTVATSSAPQMLVMSNSGSATLGISGIAIGGSNGSQYTQTNNCPNNLAAGGSCTINVTFDPTASGTASASLTITDGASGSPQTVSLLGEGVAPSVLLSPPGLTFATQTVGTTSPPQLVTLTNAGSQTLALTSITPSTGYAQTNNCGLSLAPGAACSLNVTFTPTVTGAQTGVITIVDNAAAGSQVVSLTGTGSGTPAVSLSPTSLTFSNQTVDTSSATQSITLTNTGAGPLTIISVASTGDYSQTNTCGGSVASKATCKISVAFTPTTTGARHGTLVVTDNATTSPQSVTVTGTGIAANVAFSPTGLSFANQAVNTSSATKTIVLTNNTGAKLTISQIAASSNYSQTNTCGTGIAAGATCNILVAFKPTSTGIIRGTITITDSATTSPQSVPLTGTGIAAAIGFLPATLTFADQTVGTTSSASIVTLSNTGTAALTIHSITITGANGGDFAQTHTCGGTLAPGKSCTISTTFKPTATGIRTAGITVSDSITGSPQTVPVTGTGIAPVAALSPGSIAFANQAVGTAGPASIVTLSNTGNATLTITSISISGTNGADFGQSNTCGTSLAAGTSCAIDVTFIPLAAGTRQGTLSVVDNATGSPHTASLTGVGTAPSVSFSSSTITFPSTAVGTTSPEGGVTLFNTGNAALLISSITITGANAGDFSQTSSCGISVAAGSNCTINALFGPTAAGQRTAAISVADNSTGSPQSVTLTGTGTTGGPAANISPLSLTFSSQNVMTTSPAQSLTLNNTGSSTMSIVSIIASGDYRQTNSCGTSLAASASCTVQVTFSPSATGTRAGYVTFSDNDPTTTQTVTLTGTGAAPNSTVSILPVQASVTPGQSTQFQAFISGVSSSNVTWAVDGITGGNSSIGTISSSGLYTGPSAAGPHKVTATSTANTTQSASVPVVVTSYAGTFVYHNDNGRTGQNLNETVLTSGNVNSTQFGRIFKYTVDGQIYAEPLYVQGLNVAGLGVHNVVYVATENDSVYAFDADGTSSTPLWQESLLPAGGQVLNATDIGGCSNISPLIGITSTPVIDPVTNTMFVVARSKIITGGVTSYYQYLHALDITSGAERAGSPVEIQASVTSNQGTVAFNPQMQNQRAGLFLDNGVVYIAWGAHCDILPYYGWLMGYQESTLQQAAVFNSAPNGAQSGIWQSGSAPAVDEFGYIYFMIGNGTTDVNTGGIDYGEALVKLNPSDLSLADYFLPSNFAILNNSDLDLGSGAPLLIPDQPNPPTQMLVAAGKQGMVYLVDRTNMGQYSASGNQVLQVLPAGTVPTAHSMPAYWQNNIYFCGVGDFAKSYLLFNGLLSTSPTSQSVITYAYPGATPVVSANGSTNGLLWMLTTVKSSTAVLHVYDAANLSRELYNSDQNKSRDQAGQAVKFAVPTVANGKVYIGTSTELDVYGLLPQP
jgi:FG-GAP-like repeat/Abnormal spindle-like microcephaly-assoc'd, ASPM-SPD-2-Hydin